MSNYATYLEKLVGSTEIGLVIYDKENTKYIEELTAGGFQLVNIEDIKETGKYFLVLSDENVKKLYDFAVEYPTGQFSIMNITGTRTWVTPRYDDTAIVILVEKDLAIRLQTEGVDFITLAGPTYQE